MSTVLPEFNEMIFDGFASVDAPVTDTLVKDDEIVEITSSGTRVGIKYRTRPQFFLVYSTTEQHIDSQAAGERHSALVEEFIRKGWHIR